jgi:hypothetical protein
MSWPIPRLNEALRNIRRMQQDPRSKEALAESMREAVEERKRISPQVILTE